MRVTKILLSILAVVLCVSGVFAATTTYELVTPDENLSLGYSQDDYYKLGDLNHSTLATRLLLRSIASRRLLIRVRIIPR